MKKISKVTIEEIEKSLYPLDSVYLDALGKALKNLKYLSDSPAKLYYGTKEQQKELKDFYKEILKQKDVDKILMYVMDKMRGDFQIGAFKIIASEYISDEANVEKKFKPKCALICEGRNIYHLMRIASKTLKKNKMDEEAKEMCNRIKGGVKSYDNVLRILQDYVEITSKEELEEEEY